MSKKLHPATKLLLAVGRAEYQEKCVLRHVKPLLDALADSHEPDCYAHHADKESCCEVCRLLAEWRAKL